MFALSASAAAAASPDAPSCLQLQLLMPQLGLLATPLYTKRLCHVPLAEALLKPGCMAHGQVGALAVLRRALGALQPALPAHTSCCRAMLCRPAT
jgi:hypothetical protein